MAVDLSTFPRRNLGRAEFWGRTVEQRIAEAEKQWGVVDERVGGTERATATSADELARQLELLEQALTDLPIVRTAGVSKSGFAMGAGWNTVLSTVLPFDGKGRCNVIATANVQLKAETGGSSTPSFIWPFPLSRVTSEYGPRSGRFHEGIDFAGGEAAAGNPIPCAADGTAITVNYSNGFGNYVIVSHGPVGIAGWNAYTLYAHMSATAVSQGAGVSQGQTLGYVGNTGNSFGAHLHFETHTVPPGGSLTWDNLNPSYASPRTARSPREFMDAFSTGIETSDPDVVCRLVIEGSASLSFKPFKDVAMNDGLPCWFEPVYGRALTPNGNVDVALQVWTTNGLDGDPFNKAVLTVEGIFSS